MNSLRGRLTLAFSLVAIVPLALALWLLGGRIEHTFQRQSELRLEAAIGVARGSLAADGARDVRLVTGTLEQCAPPVGRVERARDLAIGHAVAPRVAPVRRAGGAGT